MSREAEKLGVISAEAFAHLATAGKVTLCGFGSLVSEESASKSFSFTNFRRGIVRNYVRTFNKVSPKHGQAPGALLHGECAGLAFARAEGAVAHVALMDVEAGTGVQGFLAREQFYDIQPIPFTEMDGRQGVALACLESTDAEAQRLWGEAHWYRASIKGVVWRYPSATARIPLVPQAEEEEGVGMRQGAAPWPESVFALPTRVWVYPARAYLALCFQAHQKVGLGDHFLDCTLLMDRATTLREYVCANPQLSSELKACE